MNIGGYVAHLRQLKHMTLRDLAEKSGLSVSYISDIENGRSEGSIAALVKIIRAFAMSPAEFFGGLEYTLSEQEYRLVQLWREGNIAELLEMVADKLKQE